MHERADRGKARERIHQSDLEGMDAAHMPAKMCV
jgi:hypothetical protein